MNTKSNIDIFLEILENEVNGNVESALEKMSSDYTMTWMYKTKNKIFPKSSLSFKEEMKRVYKTQERKYKILNIAEGDNVIMVELIESYKDLKTKKTYKTPLVLVVEFSKGKIQTGRHYCDPDVSRANISDKQIDTAVGGKKPLFEI